MTFSELVKAKSTLLLELQLAKANRKSRQVIQRIASAAAALESQIAAHYISRGDLKNAIISLTSQASCYGQCKRFREARRTFELALDLQPANDTSRWIRSQLEQMPTTTSAFNFHSATANIFGNARLRRPQVEAYSAAKSFFGERTGHAIIQLPVGCGKTGTMALLPFDVASGRVLAVAPNVEIRSSLHKNFDHSNPENFWKKTAVLSNGSGPSCAVLNSDANILDCDESDIVVTNIQQLVADSRDKWLSQLPPDYFDMILVDEAHHNVAPTWQEVIQRFPQAKIASFTATPLRSDGQRVEGTRIYRFPIAEAIRLGYVKDIAARRLEPTEVYFTYKNEKRRHTLEEVAQLRENDWFSRGVALSPECNRNIVDASIQCMHELRQDSREKHQIIAAACSIDHAKAIRSLYAERNCAADVIHSKMDDAEQEQVRSALRSGQLDVIVHVAMLGEGADYPTLSVAAIFRPYRHVVPYVQFVGRVMRVMKEGTPGHKDNRGFVVSHFGLNIDRWWDELQQLDEDDNEFFESIANGSREFVNAPLDDEKTQRRRFRPDMEVLSETINYFVQTRFLPEDSEALVDELISAMRLRGIDPEVLGISREELATRVLNAQQEAERRGKHVPLSVQPQKARQEARKRLDERVRSGAKQLLNALGMSVVGVQLPRRIPGLGATNNLGAAIIMLNREVQAFLGTGTAERDTYSAEECQRAHDAMDSLIDKIVLRLKNDKDE